MPQAEAPPMEKPGPGQSHAALETESAMQPAPNEMARAAEWAAALRTGAGAVQGYPIGGTLGGEPLERLVAAWGHYHARAETEKGYAVETTVHRDPATGLSIGTKVHVHADFPAVEWVVRLTNEGDTDTGIFEGIQALEAALPLAGGDPCRVVYSLGSMCSRDDFRLTERHLRPRSHLRLTAGWGRSSSEVLPFFNVDFGGNGIIIGIGWTGEWAAQFSRDEPGGLSIRVGMAHTHLKLFPGEEIRTPRVLLLFWEGEPIRGHNALRRFILKHHRPRPSGQPLVAPLCNGNWGGTPADVHLDNISQIAAHDLPFEYYWIDAEWFGKPGPWPRGAGDWTPRADIYPQGLRPIGDAAHAAGLKFLLWVEPERVAPGTPWARDHTEWLLEVPEGRAVTWTDYGDWMSTEDWVRAESSRNQLNAGDRLLNLGNPDALQFLTDFLSDLINRFGIDCFRQDSNISQLLYWQNADAPDRQGMAEIRYVEGQYALWDALLERHPGLIIDNCASGGRKIDLESLGRATPLWRTDFCDLSPGRVAAQCHTWGLLHWIPLNSTSVGYLDSVSRYHLRSSMSSGLVAGLSGAGDASQPPIPEDYPFDRARELLMEYLSVREFYYGDFYPLTEYSQAEDAWMAYQLDRPEQGDGLVVVLKRPGSPYTEAFLRLRALDPAVTYRFDDVDSGISQELTGAELTTDGLRVELLDRPDSALIRYAARRES